MKIIEIIKEASPPYTVGIDSKTGQKFYQVGNQKFATDTQAVRASRRQPVAQKTQQKKSATQPAIGGRSPRMDKIVKTMTPHKGSTSQAELATMARIASAGGSAEDWQKRYGQKAKPTQVARPKSGNVGYEKTTTSFGKASDIRKPVVTQQPNDQMISVSKDNVQSAKMPNTVSKSKFKSRMSTTAGTKDPYGTDQGINLKPKKIGQ